MYILCDIKTKERSCDGPVDGTQRTRDVQTGANKADDQNASIDRRPIAPVGRPSREPDQDFLEGAANPDIREGLPVASHSPSALPGCPGWVQPTWISRKVGGNPAFTPTRVSWKGAANLGFQEGYPAGAPSSKPAINPNQGVLEGGSQPGYPGRPCGRCSFEQTGVQPQPGCPGRGRPTWVSRKVIGHATPGHLSSTRDVVVRRGNAFNIPARLGCVCSDSRICSPQE